MSVDIGEVMRRARELEGRNLEAARRAAIERWNEERAEQRRLVRRAAELEIPASVSILIPDGYDFDALPDLESLIPDQWEAA